MTVSLDTSGAAPPVALPAATATVGVVITTLQPRALPGGLARQRRSARRGRATPSSSSTTDRATIRRRPWRRLPGRAADPAGESRPGRGAQPRSGGPGHDLRRLPRCRRSPGAAGASSAAWPVSAAPPTAGFVYGGHLYIDAEGREIGGRYEPPGDEPYLKLLRGNFIAMHGTVMYRRERLLEAGGFDDTLRRCEDYDVYLRMARRFPVAGYADLVAEYRLHGANMSADHAAMLRSALDVHARYTPAPADARAQAAWRDGRRGWRRVYAEEMAAARYRDRQGGGSLLRSLPALLDTARAAAVAGVAGSVARRAPPHRPAAAGAARATAILPPADRRPPVGRVRFGDLRRVTPISPRLRLRSRPAGRSLLHREVPGPARLRDRRPRPRDRRRQLHAPVRRRPGDARRHPARPRRQPARHVRRRSHRRRRCCPENTFDCIVLTQTLHLIYDVRLAIERLRRALAPGGVLLRHRAGHLGRSIAASGAGPGTGRSRPCRCAGCSARCSATTP